MPSAGATKTRPRAASRASSGLVAVVRVVDDLDAVPDRHPHGVAAAAVGADPEPAGPGHLHRRLDFGCRHRGQLRRPRGGAQIAGEVELEQVHALAREQAARPAHGVGPVHDPAERGCLVVRQVEQVGVAEAAGDRDLGAVGEQPRAGNAAGLDLALDHHVQARLGRGGGERAGVAGVEHRARVADGGEHVLLHGQAREIVAAHVGEAQMGVRLHEAGHEGRPPSVDGRLSRSRGQRCRRDLRDPVALDAHRAREGFAARPVQDPHAGDQSARHDRGF